MIDSKKELRAKTFIRLYAAYKLQPVKEMEINHLMRDLMVNNSDTKAIIKSMIKNGELFETLTGTSKASYVILGSCYLDLLWEITANEREKFKKIYDIYGDEYIYARYYGYTINKIRDFLLNWRLTGELCSYNWMDVKSGTRYNKVLSSIPYHPRWSRILHSLEWEDLLYIASVSQISIFTKLNREEIGDFRKCVIEPFKEEDSLSIMLNSTNLLFSHILPGNILELPKVISKFTTHDIAAEALYYQYSKNYSKAVISYKKLVKSEKGDKAELTDNLLYSLFYVKALELDKKQTSISKLKKIERYVSSRNEFLYSPIMLYLDYKKDDNCLSYVDYINKYYSILDPIELVLYVMIVLHYNIGKLSIDAVNRAEDFIDSDEFLLLQLEASGSMPRYMLKRSQLIAKLGVEPIFERFRKVESWEKSLNAIGELLITNNIKNSSRQVVAAISDSRVIYTLDDRGQFQPRLQKSKDGQTWSKGRNIALSTFMSNNSEGMTDVDRVVSTCVKCYDTWGGRTYTLGGNSAFRALINHPLVFCEDNPDISISIVSDTPYVRIEPINSGYKVTSNLETEENLGSIVVIKEKKELYRVFTLTSLQCQIIELFKKQPLFPASAKEQLEQIIVDISSIITVHSQIAANNKNLKSIKGSSRITLQLLPISDKLKVELFVKPLDESNHYCRVNDGNESFIAQKDNENVVVLRNLKKEINNYNIVQQVVEETSGEFTEEDTVMYDNLYDGLELIEKIQNIDKVARVEWPKGAKLKVRGAIDFNKLNITLKSKGGWFEIGGDVNVDKSLQLTLAELLKLNRVSNGRFIELTKGEFLALSDSLRRQLNSLDANIIDGKGGIKISKFGSGIISNLEESGANVSKDKVFKELQERILAADSIDYSVPTTLKAELRDYQVDGYKWMTRLAEWGAGACLADDMGLGKTVQSIALLLNRAEQGASLIVAPASVVHNWRNELNRFAPTLNCRVLHDNIAERDKMVETATAYDVVVTTYGLLNRVTDIITSKEWNVILLDEAHNIKNRDTKSSKVAMGLDGKFKLVLTGTPIQNHLGEIWNLFNFTNPGLLGSFDNFSNKFITPIEQDGNKTIQRELKNILQPFMLRRTKSEVLDELPTKTEIVHSIELTAGEQALYENIRVSALEGIESGSLNTIQSFAEITKLRQASCHPALIDAKLPLISSKVSRFIELTTELIQNRHRALVFSQFTSFLALVRKSLDDKGIEYLYLDGSTPIKEREKLVQEFQHGVSPLFLISLKAGGTGLNLTAADYVIHLDPWWNPAIEDQASDRSHRIGQTRPVTIYRLISKNTIEEKIIELHKSKKSLADSLLEGSNLSYKLTRDDMLDLLKVRVL